MSEFSVTPFEMKMLIHYACSPGPFESPATRELVDSAHHMLWMANLLDIEAEDRAAVKITSRGRAWLERALSTPLPSQEKWVWE
jgi:hypothetical protein